MISPDETTELPLITDDQVLARVDELLDCAIRRQWWTLYLDEKGRQLPLVMPMADYPDDPDAMADTPDFSGTAAELLADRLAQIVEVAEAASLVFVWERPGGAESTVADRRWARSLGAACTAAGLRVRAQLILHDGGARWFAPDDYA